MGWPFALIILLNTLIRHVIIKTPESPKHNFTPRAYGLPEPVLVHYNRVWMFKRPNTTKVVHFFHGNGLHPFDELWRISILYDVCNCTVMLVGYLQGSTAEFVVEYETNYYLNQFVRGSGEHYLYGASFGTGAVLKGAKRCGTLVKGIILENPFTSMVDFLPDWLKVLQLFVYDKWDSLSIAYCKWDQVKSLVLSSEKDEIVPVWQHADIAYALGGKLVKLSGALHGHAASHYDYWPAVKEFIWQ